MALKEDQRLGWQELRASSKQAGTRTSTLAEMLESAPHETSIIMPRGINRIEPEQTQTRGEKMVGWMTRIPIAVWSIGKRPFFDCKLSFCL